MTDLQADLPTPPLREDLRLDEVAPNKRGEPGWVIQDYVINRFYRIGWFEFECLIRWGQTPRQIWKQINEQTALRPALEQVLGFNTFLERHHLLRQSTDALLRNCSRGTQRAWISWKWWLHHYLFFRIPLIRPQRFLKKFADRLEWLFTPWFALLIVILSITGIILVLHQWDTFINDVVESFSTEGLVSFALALIVAKTLHELGHALTATRQGLRVAHMGIAFVVLWPMLYTDTGESWKLRRAGQRLAIAAAGILTELGLAGLATLGWAVCDPGPLRNALLYLATTSWVLSLALNASPFMRFDGYFILSDLLDFPNLHERSSALARVTLRRVLLGLDEDWPEHFSVPRRRLLVTFAIATWVYRLILFLGIAVAVYLFFFKLLGIALFAVEIAWFIIMPVARELKHWWQQRAAIRSGRKWGFMAVLAMLALLLAIPWRTQVHAVGVAHASEQLRVFAPYPALLQAVRGQGEVRQGETLAVLDEPDIAARMRGNEAGMKGYRARLAGLLADPAGINEAVAIRQKLEVQFQETRAARSEMARLKLQAPFDGIWMDVDPDWQSGQWIGNQALIGILVDPARWQVDAYVKQDEIKRLAKGNRVRFYPEGQWRRIEGRVVEIATTRAHRLDYPMLADRHGGPFTTSQLSDALTPIPALFHVTIALEEAPPRLQEIRGHLQIDGDRYSPLGQLATHAFALLLRESGF